MSCCKLLQVFQKSFDAKPQTKSFDKPCEKLAHVLSFVLISLGKVTIEAVHDVHSSAANAHSGHHIQ